MEARRLSLLVDLFDSTSDLIQVFGVDGRLRLVNRSWCEHFGYNEKEAIGRNVFDLIAPDCQEHCRGVFQALLSGQLSQPIECAFIGRDGQRLSLEGQINVVFEDGTPVEVRGIFRDVSARQQAERALEQANALLEDRVRKRTEELEITKARLQEAQYLASVGHWEMDLVSGALHWSDEICRICGFDPREVTPSYGLFIETVHPDDRALMEAAYQQSLMTREPYELRYRLLLRDGAVRYVHARWVTTFDGEGQPIRSMGTSQDVTDLERVQRDLRVSEDKLRGLFDCCPMGLVLIDQHQGFSLINPSFYRISGLKADAFVASHADQALPHQLSDVLRAGEMARSSEDANIAITSQWQGAEGGIVTVNIQARAIHSGDRGNPVQVWVLVEDVSERHESESRLRQSAQVFHSAEEGIFLTDPDGIIVDVNAAFCRITGYSREAVLGETPRLFKSGVHSPGFYDQMWRQLDLVGTWRGEIVNRARDGSLQELLETISVVRDQHGAVANYVALLTDIRQLKQQQQQLQRLAHYDALTGLPNRVFLSEKLGVSLEAVRQKAGSLAIFYLDLDGFKDINDCHGHAAGDSLLKALAQRMQRVVGTQDLVARLGGDEFVAVVHDVNEDQDPLVLASALIEELAKPVTWNGLMLQVTASIGVSLYSSCCEPLGPDQLLRIADQAMYEAKRQGKNRCALISASP